jgi:hypothetical protein
VATEQEEVWQVRFSLDRRDVFTQGKGFFVHTWRLPELPARKAAPWKPTEFETAWKQLLAPDAADVAESMDRWIQSGPAAIVFFSGHVELPKPVDEALTKKSIARLGAGRFADRETAEKEIVALGEAVVPILAKLRPRETDAEIASRLQKIIDRLTEAPLPMPKSEQLRLARAVEILE